MYHCGTAPALHHIANGMYGMVIVEPKEGLPAVDKEFALVQSEWYLGPQGDLTSLEKASASAPAPDYVVFNGVANQYKDHPLEVGTGERVRQGFALRFRSTHREMDWTQIPLHPSFRLRWNKAKGHSGVCRTCPEARSFWTFHF